MRAPKDLLSPAEAGIVSAVITLREFFERIIRENDRRYEERFRGAEVAVSKAFDASKEANVIALSAQKEAVSKALDAQNAYNVVHNDLIRKMEMQGKENMPRLEILRSFETEDDKIELMRSAIEKLSDAQARLITRAETEHAALESSQNDRLILAGRLNVLEQTLANIQGRFWALSI